MVVIFSWGPFSACFQAAVMGDRVPSCAVCTGLVKPDVVFFGEALPQRFLLHLVDFPTADLLLILGTSLQVCPRPCRPEVRAAQGRSRPLLRAVGSAVSRFCGGRSAGDTAQWLSGTRGG